MRTLTGEQYMIRIFLGESDRAGHQPLWSALLERLRSEGFAGATVFRGIAGFGAHSIVRTTQILRLSQDLPIVLEVVDTGENLSRLEPLLDEMLQEGLVTIEKVRVLKYVARAT